MNPYDPFGVMKAYRDGLSAWSQMMTNASVAAGMQLAKTNPMTDRAALHKNAASVVMTAQLGAAGYMMNAAMGGLGRTSQERMNNAMRAWMGQDIHVRAP